MAPLPPGWLVRVSRSKGKVYYFHTCSQRTQWVRPTLGDDAEAEAAAAAQEHVEVSRKRPRDEPTSTADAEAPLEPAPAASETRAAVTRSMRVGGTQSRGIGGRARATFAPWEHQLEAIERVLQTITAQDATALAEVLMCVS